MTGFGKRLKKAANTELLCIFKVTARLSLPVFVDPFSFLNSLSLALTTHTSGALYNYL